VDAGQPFVIPTAFARIGDEVAIHGSAASRMLKLFCAGAPGCLTVTLVDGLVLARSAFHHSMNYRSVVVLGTPREILEPAEKTRALDAIVEHIVPGRLGSVRAGSEQELRATRVVAFALDEASAKVRATLGATHPLWVGDDDRMGETFSTVSPVGSSRPWPFARHANSGSPICSC
jgi:hypothetical protein